MFKLTHSFTNARIPCVFPLPPLPPALAISFQAPWPMLFGPGTVDFDTGIFCGPQSIAKHVLIPFPLTAQGYAPSNGTHELYLETVCFPEHCFSAPSNLPNKLEHLLIAPPALPPHCTGLAMLRLRTPAPPRHRAPCRVSSSLTPVSCFFAFVNTQKSITCLDCRPHLFRDRAMVRGKKHRKRIWEPCFY